MKPLTQEEKVAVFLRSLAPEVVDSVLAKLDPERRTQFRGLVQQHRDSGLQDGVDQVLREMEKLLPEQELAKSPGLVTSAQAAGAYSAARTSETDEPPTHDPITALVRMDPEQLAKALQGENPRAVCLVLNQLPVEQAGQLFKRLPGELRREVSVQFGNAAAPGPEVVQRIAQAVVRKTKLLQEAPAEPGPDVRHRKIAGMIRLLEREQRQEILKALEERDPAAAAAVKSQLYQFEDLLKIENRSMQKLLAELDTKTLATALHAADSAISAKVLANMSTRAQQTLNEEIELGGKPVEALLQQARRTIVDAIQRLDQTGELVMQE